MKRLIYFVSIFAFFLSNVSIADAAAFYPKTASFTSPATEYKGGATEQIQISLKTTNTDIPAESMVYDIGVAKELYSGQMVEYQILNTETVRYIDLEKNKFEYSVKIPNIFEKTKDTYVVFMKAYRQNDPDSESFAVSKSFSITPTDKKTIALDRAFLLTSTGETFGLAVGPTLYGKPTKNTHATSAELLLQLNSNAKVEVKGVMSFTKLRSNDFAQSEEVRLNVLEGKDVYGITLPTFGYEPGVYMGELLLSAEGVDIPQKINFQYIVDGSIATLGQVEFVSASSSVVEFSVPVFGRPVDIYTNGTVASSTIPEIYKTSFVFMDKDGMILEDQNTEIDFSKGVHKILLQDVSVKKISKVMITVYDESDAVIFTTSQDVSIPLPEKDVNHLIYAFMVLLLGISWYIISRKKYIILLSIVLSLIFISAYTFASWTPTDTSGNALNVSIAGDSKKTYFTFNQDFSTEPVSCTEDTDVFLKMIFLECQNRVRESAEFGVSRISMADARSKYSTINFNVASSTCVGGGEVFRYRGRNVEISCGDGGHDNFLYTTGFIKIATLRGPIEAGSKLYISVDGSKNLRAEYALPLAASSCDRCSNIAGQQTVKNFSAHGRDYFHVADGNKLYFAASSAMGASECSIDMCADTEFQEDAIPQGKVWNLSATNDYDKYSCVPATGQSCTCSGRTQVCTENGVETQTPNAQACALEASCTFTKSGNQATFTFSPLKALGTVTYSGENPVTRTIPTNGSLTESMTLTDLFDGMTASASCRVSFDDPDTAGGQEVTNEQVCDPAVTTCPEDEGGDTALPPVISKFIATRFVEQGQSCVFSWEVQNAASCTLGGQSVNPNSSKSFPTNDGRNITKTLSCTNGGDAPQVVNKTATCLVNPKVEQR